MVLFLLAWLAFRSAEAAPPGGGPQIDLQVVAEKEPHTASGTLNLGILFRIEKGWHIYWRNPGDSGLPTSVAWQPPAGFIAHETLWPVPKRFVSEGSVSYGYEKEVLLVTPFQLPPGQKGPKTTFAAQVEWLACKETCVPGEKKISMVPAVMPKKFQEAFRGIPRQPTAVTLSARRLKEGIGLTLQAKEKIENLYFFPEEEEVIEYSGKQILRQNGNHRELVLPISIYAKRPPQRLRGVLAVLESSGKTQTNWHIDLSVQ